MNAFLDTNVIIGYIYSLDPLHAASRKAIVDENTKYYSFHVNEEIKDVFKRKDREYAKFLTKLEKIFNKYGDSDFIDLAEIHMKVNRFGQIGKFEVDDMHKAIDVIWQELNFDENTDAFKVKIEFNNYFGNFESKHRNGKKDCLKKMNFIPAYQNKDPNVLKAIHRKSLRNYFHGEDEKILFDVHEYLKTNTIKNLVLISNDKDFIKAISELISVLSFNRFKYLEDLLKN
ncbi:MAG: hypothetical protein IJN03_02295 [Bacilli bacterium]|nr:hypothetical protein [Methanobrevibacter sp.]MBQ6687336.1 hypothetical protein [Bacilli bacterium]